MIRRSRPAAKRRDPLRVCRYHGWRYARVSEVTTAEDIVIIEAAKRDPDTGLYECGRHAPKHEDCVALFQQFCTSATNT